MKFYKAIIMKNVGPSHVNLNHITDKQKFAANVHAKIIISFLKNKTQSNSLIMSAKGPQYLLVITECL